MDNNQNQILNNVLDAREKRASLRFNFIENNYNTLSLSLNIPGYPKSNPLINSFFTIVLSELKTFLIAQRIEIENNQSISTTDNAGDFFITPLSKKIIDLKEIKNITESFEENHSLGRLIDIDIFNNEGQPVSSGKKKSCFFCSEHSAISCMRNKRHAYDEIRTKIDSEITIYLEEKRKELIINSLTSYATKAILYEISLSPKPGLVSFNDTGSHKDMNFFTFLNSSASLTPFFKEFSKLGYQFSGEYEDVLPQIREIGLRAEEAMFSATNKVNTHKGIIFLFGLSLFTIAKLFSKKEDYSDENFRLIIKNICNNIVEKELLNDTNTAITHGEKVFQKYGKIGAGVRQEVEDGFPSVFDKSLTYFNNNLNSLSINNEKEIQIILQTGLLQIMSVNNDSNILYRSNLETLKQIQTLAKEAIKSNKNYTKLCEYCLEKNISPGGSADLLSVSLLLHFVKTELL